MSPKENARLVIDRKLTEAGWLIQNLKQLNPFVYLGIAVREFSTPGQYFPFIDWDLVDIAEYNQYRP